MEDFADQIETNYLEARARDVAEWMRRARRLTGRQRAVLVMLSSAIDEALEDDVIEGDTPGDQLVASPAGGSARSLIGRP